MQRAERADRETVAQHASERAIAAILLRRGAHRHARRAHASRRGFPSTGRTGSPRRRRAARRRPSSRGCRRASSRARPRRAGPSARRAREHPREARRVFHSNQNSNRSPLISSDAARPGSARRNESSRRSVGVRRVTEMDVGDDVAGRGKHAVSLHGGHRLYKRVACRAHFARDAHSEPRASMPLTHATELRVRYAETDRMGVVYYANYLVWCEVGRVEFMRALGRKLRGARGGGHTDSPSPRRRVRYLAPARFDDLVRIETTLTGVRSRAVTFDYVISHAETGARLATAHTALVSIDATGRLTALPRDFRALLEGCALAPRSSRCSSRRLPVGRLGRPRPNRASRFARTSFASRTRAAIEPASLDSALALADPALRRAAALTVGRVGVRAARSPRFARSPRTPMRASRPRHSTRWDCSRTPRRCAVAAAALRGAPRGLRRGGVAARRGRRGRSVRARSRRRRMRPSERDAWPAASRARARCGQCRRRRSCRCSSDADTAIAWRAAYALARARSAAAVRAHARRDALRRRSTCATTWRAGSRDRSPAIRSAQSAQQRLRELVADSSARVRVDRGPRARRLRSATAARRSPTRCAIRTRTFASPPRRRPSSRSIRRAPRGATLATRHVASHSVARSPRRRCVAVALARSVGAWRDDPQLAASRRRGGARWTRARCRRRSRDSRDRLRDPDGRVRAAAAGALATLADSASVARRRAHAAARAAARSPTSSFAPNALGALAHGRDRRGSRRRARVVRRRAARPRSRCAARVLDRSSTRRSRARRRHFPTPSRARSRAIAASRRSARAQRAARISALRRLARQQRSAATADAGTRLGRAKRSRGRAPSRASRPSGDARARAVRRRRAGHRRQLRLAGAARILRRSAFPPRRAQLRRAGRRSARRRQWRTGVCHSRRDESAPLRARHARAWRCRDRTRAEASSSSRTPRSRISTAGTPSSGSCEAADDVLDRIVQGDRIVRITIR